MASERRKRPASSRGSPQGASSSPTHCSHPSRTRPRRRDTRREAHERLARTITDPRKQPLIERWPLRVPTRRSPGPSRGSRWSGSAGERPARRASSPALRGGDAVRRNRPTLVSAVQVGDLLVRRRRCHRMPLALLEQLLTELGPGLERATTLYTMANGSWNDVKKVGPLLDRALETPRATPSSAWRSARSGPGPPCCPATSRTPSLPRTARSRTGRRTRRARAVGTLPRSVVRPGPGRRRAGRTPPISWSEIAHGGPHRRRGGHTSSHTWSDQTWIGDLEAARTSLHRELDRFLQRGHASGTWEIHTDLADLEFRAGRWAQASTHAARLRR